MIDVFMFSCLHKLIWIQVQHHLLKIQERRRPGLLRLLLQGKGDERPHGILLTCVVRVVDPLVPSYPPFPLLISIPFPIYPSRGEEEARASPPPPPPRKRRRRSARRSSPSRCRRPLGNEEETSSTFRHVSLEILLFLR